MFFTTGHRPRTVQRVALGAKPDGKLTTLIHEGTGETSRYEQYIEALTSPSSFMYSCPNVVPPVFRAQARKTMLHALGLDNGHKNFERRSPAQGVKIVHAE
jgi:CO/xanthine dehydrogenase Mo-binding subunit